MIHRLLLRRTAVLALTTVIAACGPAWKPAFDEKAPAELFESVAIADPDEALTFARVVEDGRARVIGVGSYRDGAVEGVDLAAALGRDASDPITLFGEVGYERLRDLLRDPPASARVSVPAASLVSPVDLRDHHVAAGTNYPEHADDAGVEDGPFLFAKMVDPTGPYDEVPAGAGLLDCVARVTITTPATTGPTNRTTAGTPISGSTTALAVPSRARGRPAKPARCRFRALDSQKQHVIGGLAWGREQHRPTRAVPWWVA